MANLIINGSIADESLQLELGQGGPNSVRITADDGVFINGSPDPVVFSDVVSGVLARLNSGDDRIFIGGADVSGPIELHGDQGNDVFYLESMEAFVLQGGDDADLLDFNGAEFVLDSTSASQFVGNEVLDFDNEASTDVRLQSDAVDTITPLGLLKFRYDDLDLARYEGSWSVESPKLSDGRHTHVLTTGQTTVEIRNARPWQNPLDMFDVGFDGDVTALDALRIINRLARQSDADLPGLDKVDSPFEFYYDVNGDQQATALDALRVINEMARQSDRDVESEKLQATTIAGEPNSTSPFLGRHVEVPFVRLGVDTQSHGQSGRLQSGVPCLAG